ncbi:unnamed protein product [Paramecium sonneborni]|uniref:MORN repeat-containing protein n=1 Tax=Paramecium sonneborni TaxID=65129 RepID=A0A8S1RMP9_9CILI|nr:unnamed protein product [Paramecium sonneborni]
MNTLEVDFIRSKILVLTKLEGEQRNRKNIQVIVKQLMKVNIILMVIKQVHGILCIDKTAENHLKNYDGSYYYIEGVSRKFGKWTELRQRFYEDKQIIYNGGYDMQGNKKGRWGILYRYKSSKPFEIIGGGLYLEKVGGTRKFGKWIELDEQNIDWNYNTLHGEYNDQGMKVGQWVIQSEKVEFPIID